MSASLFFRIIRLVAALSLILLLLGCGGGGGGGGDGGGGSSPTPEDISFKSFPDDYFIAGHHESYSLTGSDTAGGKYEASFYRQTSSSTMFNGEQAIPVNEIIEITNTITKAFISISLVGYFSDSSSNRRLLGVINNTIGVTYLASSTNVIPQVAQIGDLGTIGTFVGSDGSSISESWRITNANNGLANWVVSATAKDEYGNIESNSDITSLVDQNCNTYSVTYRIYLLAEHITLTLSGK